jgi:hypothetical protein
VALTAGVAALWITHQLLTLRLSEALGSGRSALPPATEELDSVVTNPELRRLLQL